MSRSRTGGPSLRALKLYHGKSGAGLSVEFKVRLGPVTILGRLADRRRTTEADRRRGRVDSGPDLPDREHELAHPLRPGAGPRSWTPGAPRGRRTTSRSGIGHQLDRIRKVADLLGLELAVVE